MVFFFKIYEICAQQDTAMHIFPSWSSLLLLLSPYQFAAHEYNKKWLVNSDYSNALVCRPARSTKKPFLNKKKMII